MFIDLMGGVFSAVSLVFKPSFDTFAAIPYLLVVVSLMKPTKSAMGSLMDLGLGLRRRSDRSCINT